MKNLAKVGNNLTKMSENMKKPKTKKDWALYRAILASETGIKKIEESENGDINTLNYSIFYLLLALNGLATAFYEEEK